MRRWIFAGLLFLAATPAFAAPSDEAMSGAFRCAAISDNRIWLECYYGAAQPVRRAGIAACPTAQIKLVQAPPAGAVTPGDLSVRNAVLADAFRCTVQDNQRPWLNCYYAAAQRMRAQLGLVPSSPPPPAAPPQPAPAFGLRPAPPPVSRNSVSAGMSAYSFDRFGVFTVTLDNGEVWQQVAGDDARARWRKPAGRYAVRIERGFLGAYNFQVRNEPGLYRVRRIK